MSPLVFSDVTVVLPDRLLPDAEVICEGTRIVEVNKARRRPRRGAHMIAGRGAFLAPGFVDIHVHGGGGADFMDGNPAAIRTALRTHARHGTTSLFPTTTTGSPEEIGAMLAATAEVRRTWRIADGARIAGVHLYGPFFAADKVGCHDPKGRRAPKPSEYERYFSTDLVRIATCAAELSGAAAFYRLARRRRCLVTCGHSNASWPEMAAAFENGMRHVDHFWCAMSNVSSVRQRLGVPMRGSMLEFVLGEREMSTEVIADGCHLAPELLDFAFRMKGAQRLCLVTDCSRALDLPAGRYRFGPEATGSWFRSDGRVGWAGNGSLASSVAGMDHMVRHIARHTSASLPDVVRMASLTPAERAGIARSVGSVEPGKFADLVLLNSALRVHRVFIGGDEFSPARAHDDRRTTRHRPRSAAARETSGKI